MCKGFNKEALPGEPVRKGGGGQGGEVRQGKRKPSKSTASGELPQR